MTGAEIQLDLVEDVAELPISRRQWNTPKVILSEIGDTATGGINNPDSATNTS